MSTNRLSPTTVAIAKHHTNHHSQYYTTKICRIWAKIEAVDSHTLALKHSIDRIQLFAWFRCMHPDVKNVKFLRCSHVMLSAYSRINGTFPLFFYIVR